MTKSEAWICFYLLYRFTFLLLLLTMMWCAPFRLFIHLNGLVSIVVTLIFLQSTTSPMTTPTKQSITGSSCFYHRQKEQNPESVDLSTIIWLLTSEGKKVSQLSDDTQQRAIFFVNVVVLNCWVMGLQTMEQQAAPGTVRTLPAALDCSNDSLSTSSRCLPFKAGQVNKVSLSKSINKGLFTH